jgi:hypothetical protein
MERYFDCPRCLGTGTVAYLDGKQVKSTEPHAEAHHCSSCDGEGYWGGAFDPKESWALKMPPERY